ncbi:hypothetical protein XA68_12133 [Ophiocordyceps unilateralis]|uniref:Pyrroloquinoline quinone-dependent pyranose dehydrogenase beta-propeller domain-containing protein n=1 Tax=Ophiocordyceps unilateralis TaxID=268505 RepID=A0A2A9PDW5_OPHUN|nr:hypothetical protein XA68_12133 [Ophiocordyceps unilateralis]
MLAAQPWAGALVRRTGAVRIIIVGRVRMEVRRNPGDDVGTATHHHRDEARRALDADAAGAPTQRQPAAGVARVRRQRRQGDVGRGVGPEPDPHLPHRRPVGGFEAGGVQPGGCAGLGVAQQRGCRRGSDDGQHLENSLDNMHRHGRDIHQTNPGDELNFHGRPDDRRSDVFGRNFGYPACLAIWDPSVVEGYPGGAKTGQQMTGDHMAGNKNNSFSDEWCRAKTVAPVLTLDSHLAPLDIEFLPDGTEAYVSMHGSWNREPGVGYRVSRFAFGADGFPVDEPSSRSAERHMVWDVGGRCPSEAGDCFRPVGLALVAAGRRRNKGTRLFVTSDDTGELFVVAGLRGGER